MSKEINDILKSLAKRDIEALKSIYNYRCLTINQVYELHYKKSQKNPKESVSDAYCKKKMNEFVALEIVEKVEHVQGDVLFLTTKGIDVIRTVYDMPTNIYNYSTNSIRNGYYRAAELKVSNKFINHQLHMNQFMIDFTLRDLDVVWKYYDEKHLSKFNDIRPDGLLSMLDVDYFIEMDMATESKLQLQEKWENYRRFLNSQEFLSIERKIVVLFVTENTKNPQARIDLVKHTLGSRLMDKLDDNFDIVVNVKEKLLDYLEERVDEVRRVKRRETDDIFKAFAEKGFSVALGESLKKSFNNVEYEFYIRKIDNNNHIIVENGKLQEFLVDSYKNEPFSVMKKAGFLAVSNIFFQEKLKRKLSYIIVVSSENELYRDLNILDMKLIDNVYYTTLERLQTRTFPEALFQFDSRGNVYHFIDHGLQNRLYEQTVTGLMDGESSEEQVMEGGI